MQEGLMSLLEISQREMPQSQRARDQSLSITTSNLFWDQANLKHPNDFSKNDPRLKKAGFDSVQDYRDATKGSGPYGGVETIRHNDGNYSEWRPERYQNRLGYQAQRDRQRMLDAGGIEHSDSSITYQDSHQLGKSFKKTLELLRNRPLSRTRLSN